MREKVLRATTLVLMSGALALVGSGQAIGIAQAEPIPAPLYHWCPGDFWDPFWGFNFDWYTCHDDWHRDSDGDRHDRDWRPDRDDDHDHDWHHDQDDRHDHRDGNGPWEPWPPR